MNNNVLISKNYLKMLNKSFILLEILNKLGLSESSDYHKAICLLNNGKFNKFFDSLDLSDLDISQLMKK